MVNLNSQYYLLDNSKKKKKLVHDIIMPNSTEDFSVHEIVLLKFAMCFRFSGSSYYGETAVTAVNF
jgi:hypothetical protein